MLAQRANVARGICDVREATRCGRVCCFNGFAAEVEKAAEIVVGEANRGAASARRQDARGARKVAMSDGVEDVV